MNAQTIEPAEATKDVSTVYVVQHHHRFGTSTYLLRFRNSMPTYEKIIKALDLDFEEEREECIEWDAVDVDNIQTV